jgi:hypothetical protein
LCGTLGEPAPRGLARLWHCSHLIANASGIATGTWTQR